MITWKKDYKKENLNGYIKQIYNGWIGNVCLFRILEYNRADFKYAYYFGFSDRIITNCKTLKSVKRRCKRDLAKMLYSLWVDDTVWF